ncbi:MAG: lipoprotein-releasing ABC transporter permease subunit [Alphaproteobacteria bacterium]
MFSPFERLVAFRYLRARRSEGFISVIAGFSLAGIALGVATLIIVMSVMNGFREELLNRILGVNGHLTVLNVAGAISDYDQLARRTLQVQGVQSAVPIVDGQVMATGGRSGSSSGALVRGLRLADLKTRPLIAGKIVAGSLDALAGDDAVVIGARLAGKLGLGVGDRITLISPKGNVTAFGTVPRLRAYTIVATFEVGMFEYDSTFVFMPLDAAQRYFNLEGAATGIEVMVDQADRAPALARALAVTLGRDFQVYDWQRANASFFNAIKVERNVMFLILTLIIMVAAFNIISGLIMLVKDKGRDIAILRTMGATRGMILRIFLLSGASLGIMGTVAGVILGVVFADNIETMRQWLQSLTGTDLFAAEIYFLSQLPSRLYAEDVIAVVGMALALAFLATIYPAWRAARLDPVEALRYE